MCYKVNGSPISKEETEYMIIKITWRKEYATYTEPGEDEFYLKHWYKEHTLLEE